MLSPLAEKVALITGSSRGIGAAIAIRMARMGASVVINYRNNRECALEVLQKVKEEGGRGIIVQADVTEREAVEEMDRTIREKFGEVEILVSNAGFTVEINPLHKISLEGLIGAANHEFSALHNCSQIFVPGMIEKKKGKIVVISSRVANQPLPGLGAYAAAKAGLEALANTMAIELGPFGITINIVRPAFTLTDGSKVMPEGYKEKARQSRPLRKDLYPEDVAGTVAFLATGDADMVTGSTIQVSGGSHL